MADAPINEIPAVWAALRNELVLDTIFQFLPMNTLLCCSEVCQIWKKQARVHIRDKRKSTVRICSGKRLKDLNETVAKMSEVPFNSLNFRLMNSLHQNVRHRSAPPRDQTTGGGSLDFENLMARMKLKYLSIWLEQEDPRCPALFAAFRFLLEKRNEIKDLKIGRISSSFMKRFMEINELQMLQLESLQIDVLDNEWSRDLIGKILGGNNPRMKKIINNGGEDIFEILPQSKHGLLSNFTLMDSTQQDLNRGIRLAQSRPTLSNLKVSMLQSARDPRLALQCLQTAQALLQSSSKSIVELNVSPTDVLRAISFPPLENLRFLTLNCYGNHGEMTSSLQSIPFGRLFPKLQRAELLARALEEERELQAAAARHPEFDHEPALAFNQNPQNASMTTSLLVLKEHIHSLSFVQLQKSFPAVDHICMIPEPSDAHLVPYGLIFRLWPNLRTLVISGSTLNRLPNSDAEFCGINQEEAELLRSMDGEYLRNVHIVPVRPCVTTMPNLRQIAVCLSGGHAPYTTGYEPDRRFLSSVTKFLVLQRMPWVRFHVG